MIGRKVILLRDMLGEKAGSIGYVFNEYPDFDEKEKPAIQVIFKNGGYDGFSVADQRIFLKVLNSDQRYIGYVFNNVNQVWQDYQKGYWKFD